jgi:hypothetical protein
LLWDTSSGCWGSWLGMGSKCFDVPGEAMGESITPGDEEGMYCDDPWGLEGGGVAWANSQNVNNWMWYQTDKLLIIVDWRSGDDWEGEEVRTSSCDLNDWTDLGQAMSHLPGVGW